MYYLLSRLFVWLSLKHRSKVEWYDQNTPNKISEKSGRLKITMKTWNVISNNSKKIRPKKYQGFFQYFLLKVNNIKGLIDFQSWEAPFVISLKNGNFEWQTISRFTWILTLSTIMFLRNYYTVRQCWHISFICIAINNLFLTLSAPTPQNGQTHSNNLSDVADELFECI